MIYDETGLCQPDYAATNLCLMQKMCLILKNH
jgi:hypothetical protein